MGEGPRRITTVKNFGDLAEQYSIEAGSRSLRGEVPPIQKHGGQPLLEKEAFALKPGELSGIIQVGDTYVILFCEGRTKPINTSFEEVKDLLYRDIHEKKLRMAMAKIFDDLKDNSRIDNFLAGNLESAQEGRGGRGRGGHDRGPEGSQAEGAQANSSRVRTFSALAAVEMQAIASTLPCGQSIPPRPAACRPAPAAVSFAASARLS